MKKKYILLSVIISLTTFFQSCSDHLNVERYFSDRQDLERVFNSRDYTEQWLANAYYQLLSFNLEIGHVRFTLTETLFRYTYNYWTFDRFNSYEDYYNEIIPAGNIAYSNILTKDEVIKDGYKVLTIKTKKNNSYSTITLTMDNYLVTTHCNIETKNYSSSTISDDYLISTYYYDYSIDYNSDFTYRTSI